MKPLPLPSKKRYGITSIILVTLFSVVFSGLAIYSAHEQDKGVKILVKHPITVSAAIYNVRKSIFEMQVYMGRLEMYHSPKDVVIVRKRIAQAAAQIVPDVAYIVNYYLGPPAQAQLVKDSLQEAYALQQRMLQNESVDPSSLEFQENIRQLAVIYDKVDDVFTNKMLKFIEGTGNRLSKQSSQVLLFTVLISLGISLLMIASVIIAQRVAAARMKEKEHRDYILKIISENADTAFMLYNLRHKVMEYVSPNLVHMVGEDSTLFEKHPERLREYCDKSETKCFDMLFGSEILRTPFSEEVLFKNVARGTEQWGLVNIYPVREAEQITQYIISISNLMEMKKTQQVLKDALVNAQNANKAKSQFFSRMSHDIRTPMNAIIGMTTIAASALDDKVRLEHCLSKITASSRHLLMLINDVLDMSKIESGKFTLADTPFSLVEFIKNLTALVYIEAKAKNLHFDVTVSEMAHETLRGDPLRLNQILINILSNALKFTPEGGSIAIHIEQKPDKYSPRVWLYCTVSDTGIGMSPEFLERLFMPFEQEHTLVDSSAGGTGLGMAIVKNIVTLMNGSIQVESTQGKGTTFKLAVSFEAETSTRCQTVELDALNVLVVDDDPGTCEHAAIILERIGVRAEWVLSGKEAVVRIFDAQDQHNAFDVVFLDWKMPDMSGLEITRRVRSRLGPETLIIIISAYDWTEIETEARMAGVNAFIAKPMFQSTIYNTLLSVTKGLPLETVSNTTPDFSGKHFLLAEDNEINAEIVVELLKPTNATVEVVGNGQLAVARVEQSAPGTYAAILMDVQMPVMSGYQATENIRALDHPDAASVPIIAMTANAFVEDVAMALRSGMNDHMSKPIDTQLMYKKLQTWVENSVKPS